MYIYIVLQYIFRICTYSHIIIYIYIYTYVYMYITHPLFAGYPAISRFSNEDWRFLRLRFPGQNRTRGDAARTSDSPVLMFKELFFGRSGEL